MTRYKKASNGQWPGYPHLQLNDISTLTIRQNRFISEALVNNRKGRFTLLMDEAFHQKFLITVRKRKGEISVLAVNDAIVEAVKEWVEKES